MASPVLRDGLTLIGPDYQRRVRPMQRDGVWVIDGDVLIDARAVSAPVVDAEGYRLRYARPWTCARVYYRYSSDPQYRVGARVRRAFRLATQAFEARSRLRFIELGDDHSVDDYIEVRQWSKGWGSSSVGMKGGAQRLNLPGNAPVRLAMHELGHAVGMSHVHQRPDRDQFVQFNPECVPDEHQDAFVRDDDRPVIGSYDFDSIMHYRSYSFCRKDTIDADDDGSVRECGYTGRGGRAEKCYPLERKAGPCSATSCADADGDGFRESILGAERLSDGDVAWLETRYGPTPVAAQDGDGFGRALAAGDFDGDGLDDLVAAAPHHVDGAGAGTFGFARLELFKGDGQGLVACGTLGRGDAMVRQQPAHWGASLRVGDIDGDGIDDLLVGAPSRLGVVGRSDAGGVGIYFGSDAENDAWAEFRSLDLWLEARELGLAGATAAGFGASVELADFDGDGRRSDIVVGFASVDARARQGTHAPALGLAAVRARKWSGASLMHFDELGLQAGSPRFGATLRAFDIDGQPGDELAVAAPCSSEDTGDGCRAGVVVVGEDGFGGLRLVQEIRHVEVGPSAFAASLLVFDIDDDGQLELLVTGDGDSPGPPRRSVATAVEVFAREGAVLASRGSTLELATEVAGHDLGGERSWRELGRPGVAIFGATGIDGAALLLASLGSRGPTSEVNRPVFAGFRAHAQGHTGVLQNGGAYTWASDPSSMFEVPDLAEFYRAVQPVASNRAAVAWAEIETHRERLWMIGVVDPARPGEVWSYRVTDELPELRGVRDRAGWRYRRGW